MYLYHRHHYYRIQLPWPRYSLFPSSHLCSCTSSRPGIADKHHCCGTRSGNPLQKDRTLFQKVSKRSECKKNPTLSMKLTLMLALALKDSAISARNTYLVCNDVHSSLACKYRFRCYRNRENHTEHRTPPGRNVTLQDEYKQK